MGMIGNYFDGKSRAISPSKEGIRRRLFSTPPTSKKRSLLTRLTSPSKSEAWMRTTTATTTTTSSRFIPFLGSAIFLFVLTFHMQQFKALLPTNVHRPFVRTERPQPKSPPSEGMIDVPRKEVADPNGADDNDELPVGNLPIHKVTLENEDPKTVRLTPLRPIDRDQYTIRINTWKRPEQLLLSVNHHASCPGVALIQIVWCDKDEEPPNQLLNHSKVVIEHHNVNTLNERFHILSPVPTLGILSLDDDVLRPCEAIDAGFFKWTQSPHRMVGFDARVHVENPDGTWAVRTMKKNKINK